MLTGREKNLLAVKLVELGRLSLGNAA